MKTTILIITALMITGCTNTPSDIPMSGESTTKVETDTKANVFGFDSLLDINVITGDTYNVSNDKGTFNVPNRRR